MGFFDRFKKQGGGGGDGKVVTQSISFEVGPDTREVDSEGVDALDDGLQRVGSGEVMHMIDPRRINAFTSGGPATWSVGVVPVGDDQLFVTYGFSDRIDPARQGTGFELSIRVPSRTAGMWPGMLLRQLARYMLTSRRELKVSDFLPFGTPLPLVVPGAADPSQLPATAMDAVFLVDDPLLPRVRTPRGDIEIRGHVP